MTSLADARLVENAALFAERAHREQKYGGRPYIEHLVEVHGLVSAFAPEDIELRQAAFLHDVIEDTEVGFEKVRDVFGVRVAALVLSVTSIGLGSRADRNPVVYKSIALEGPDALLLKLCDRLANVRNCWKYQNPLLFMYYKEHPYFRETLLVVGGKREEPLWNELNILLGVRGSSAK
jgi:(p)ppGpp synthase/HD superfamily hydrolase